MVEIIQERSYQERLEVFTWYAEKSAKLDLTVSPKTGELAIALTPSNLAGTKGKQQIVQKGTKIYDYQRQACSNIPIHEVQQLVDYLRSYCELEETLMLTAMQSLTSAMDPNGAKGIRNQVDGIMNRINMRSGARDNGITLFRIKDTPIKKTWNFNLTDSDYGGKIMYVSVNVEKDGNKERIFTTLTDTTIRLFYNALKSYLNNYTILKSFIGVVESVKNNTDTLKVGMYTQLIGLLHQQCSNDQNTQNKLSNVYGQSCGALLDGLLKCKSFKDILK